KIMEMLGLVELKQTRFYQEVYGEGKAEGKAEGKVEGKAEGKAEGQQQGEATLLLRQLSRKFGSLTPAQTQTIASLPTTQLESLGEALLGFTVQGDLDDWLESFPTG
ncbi:DUF4351 domain-containing protein, partial [Gloeomargarita lithophora]